MESNAFSYHYRKRSSPFRNNLVSTHNIRQFDVFLLISALPPRKFTFDWEAVRLVRLSSWLMGNVCLHLLSR